MQENRVPGAKSYLYQYITEPVTAESVWENSNGTVSKTVFKNLQSSDRYYVRIKNSLNKQKKWRMYWLKSEDTIFYKSNTSKFLYTSLSLRITSIRLSGTSHIMATSTYKAPAIHSLTQLTPIAVR